MEYVKNLLRATVLEGKKIATRRELEEQGKCGDGVDSLEFVETDTMANYGLEFESIGYRILLMTFKNRVS